VLTANPTPDAKPLPPATPLGAAPVLSLRDVHFGYDPGRPILKGVSADLPGGQVCALIGPNAAGKSTLLRLLLGQLEPASGDVRLLGDLVARHEPRRRAALLSYVPQRAGASFAYTVEEVVAMGRYALPADAGAVERGLTACDLADLRERVYAELSVGQQQRVILARALAQAAGQGRAMLLDEPASAMDLWHVHHTMGLLADRARAGLAVLVVVHDLNLAARYADTVWLLDDGRLAAAGPWREVLTPAVLEPIYRVRLSPLTQPGSDRPVFLVDPSGRL
jgi:iron complex transport system ATP-binding protein